MVRRGRRRAEARVALRRRQGPWVQEVQRGRRRARLGEPDGSWRARACRCYARPDFNPCAACYDSASASRACALASSSSRASLGRPSRAPGAPLKLRWGAACCPSANACAVERDAGDETRCVVGASGADLPPLLGPQASRHWPIKSSSSLVFPLVLNPTGVLVLAAPRPPSSSYRPPCVSPFRPRCYLWGNTMRHASQAENLV